MQDIDILFPKNVKELAQLSKTTWDFKNNPHLFPLYLFLHFYEKYCKGGEVSKQFNSFYSRDSVYCRCDMGLKNPDFVSWICASKAWSTIRFNYIVAKKDFIPFSEKNADIVATVTLSLSPMDKKYSAAVHMWTVFDYSILFSVNTIAVGIEEVMKKYDLGFEKTVRK